MELSNTEQEITWLDAWSHFYTLIEQYPNGYILLPDFKETNKEEAKGWIQAAVYESYRIEFSVEYFKGQKSIFIHKVHT